MLIDSLGLNRVISFAVGLWSCAGIATGFTRGLGGLVGCRAVLGVAEAAGIPAAGKAIHKYLLPGERALGNAVNQAGVSLGQIVAPVLATWIAVRSGWRAAFILTGVLGLAWIPLWNWAARRAPGGATLKQHGGAAMLRDRRLWVFVIANALSMMGYYLWFN
jgi:ACS family hexuronate transporter-like MFS transporter